MREQLPYTHTSVDDGVSRDVVPTGSVVWRRIMRGAFHASGGDGSLAFKAVGPEITSALNSAIETETHRRIAFMSYYSRQVGEAALRSLIRTRYQHGGHRFEPLVLDFAGRIHDLERDDDAAGYPLRNGISCEIAHVAQGGDWGAADMLDASMAEMVSCDRIDDARGNALDLTERYARSPELARTRMHPLAFSMHDKSMTPFGLIVRNRAYADYEGDIRIVRRSSYLASPTLMDAETRTIHEALLATDDRDIHKIQAATMLRRFVENNPDPQKRQDDPSILPVQTTYFLLHRRDEAAENEPSKLQ